MNKDIHEPVAIVGIGCRFPGNVSDVKSYWELLTSATDAITDVPKDRWDSSALYSKDVNSPGKTYATKGGFLSSIDMFDPEFFKITPREAAHIDPQQRILLETAYEAMADAGELPERLSDIRTGVFVGLFIHDYQHMQLSNREQLNAHTGTGTAMSIAANRLSYAFDLKGPSMAVDTACSSSLLSIHLAYQSIKNGECDAALAGGVNIIIKPEMTIAMSKASMLSPDGHCFSFDSRANGYVRGEGAGMVLLKPLSHAIRDNDNIYSVIIGSACNQDGKTVGISVPNGTAQEMLLATAIKNANISAKDISYVEAHGTGTPVGDPIEANALGHVLSIDRDPKKPCIIGSVKSNMGHLESASGVAGLIKAALILKNEKIPANLNFLNPNPKIDMNKLNIRIPIKLESWESQSTKIAGVNSFGFGGTNVHIIVQEYPINKKVNSNDTTVKSNNSKFDYPHIIKLAAHNANALCEQASLLKEFIKESHPTLSDVAYTRSNRCSDFEARHAIVVDDEADLIQQLDKLVATESSSIINADSQKSPLFVFTGMGPQWWGMGRELMAQEPVCREVIERVDAVLKPLVEWSLIEELNKDEDISRINETVIAQPAIFAIQIALWELWKKFGITPSAVMGHSVGEVSAAYVSGALTFEDAILLSYHRSRLQNRARGTGSMLAVGLGADKIRELFPNELSHFSIAAANSPSSTTLSGKTEALQAIEKTLSEKDIFARFLKVEVPYHSQMMDPLKEDLLASLLTLKPQKTHTHFYSTVTGGKMDGSKLNANYWWNNVRDPVLFSDSLINWCNESNCTELAPIIEIGPHPVLSNSIKECLVSINKTSLCTYSLRRGDSDRKTILTSLATLYNNGSKISWSDVYPTGTFLKLPRYPWQTVRCWSESVQAANERKGYTSDDDAVQHPLVGGRLNISHPTWSQLIDISRFPYLIDHKIQNEIVFPGAGYIEMACSTANVDWESEECIVENLALMKAFFMSESDNYNVQISHEENNYFTVSSRQENSDNWNQHCRGVVRKQKRTKSFPDIDLDIILSRCNKEISSEYLYELFSQIGFDYGPRFQEIVQIFQGHDECLAKIRSSDENVDNKYQFHPTLLDASLHSLFGALSLTTTDARMRNQAYLPVNISRCHLLSKPNADYYWSHAKITKRDKHSFLADVTVYSDILEPIMFIEGLRCEAIDFSQDSIEKHSLEWMYCNQWKEVSAPVTFSPDKNLWLVFTNTGSDFLNQLLTKNNQDFICVQSGNDFIKVNDKNYRVNPEKEDHYSLLFDEIEKDQLYIKNIVYGFAFLNDIDNIVSSEDIMKKQVFGFGSVISILKNLIQLPKKPVGLCLLTCETLEIDNGNKNIIQSPLVGLIRVMGNEHPDINSKVIDVQEFPGADDQSLLIAELSPKTKEGEVVIKFGNRYVRRLVRRPIRSNKGINTADSKPFAMVFEEPGHLDSLVYNPILLPTPKANEVVIEVKKSALNFKDVLKASGLFPIDLMEENLWSGDGLGMECAGVIYSIGDDVTNLAVGQRVMALAPNSLRSHVQTHEALAIPIAKLSDEHAAAMPMVYLTAYYGLVELARLARGERVLIHAAAGGVGQAAIQLAQWIGAEIYVTVSSPEKVAIIKNCGIKNIYNSRSTNFAQEIMDDTNGEGIDVVLNSLAGTMIDLSFSLLREYGRFVEIGKMDINRNKMIGMKPFHYNLSFFALDLDRMLKQKPKQCGVMLNTLHDLYLSGDIKPLITTCYTADKAVSAFKWMLSGEHTGKLVISLSDPKNVHLADSRTPLFNESTSILITGGLGGFGSSLAHWLADRGCKHLYLSGRQGAKTSSAKKLVVNLEKKGVTVTVIKADVSSETGISRIIAAERKNKPINGIFHAAGMLDDALLLKQNMEKYGRVAETKISGTWNLHHMSETWNLDYFVMFSSVATTLGNQGSGNYAAVNAFMDSFAHYRKQKNLVALTVNWGVIADVGMAADEDFYRRSLEENGLQALHSTDGLDLMGVALCDGDTQVTISPVDWKKWLKFNPAGKESRFLELANSQRKASSQSTEEQSLRQTLLSASEGEVVALAEKEVQETIAQLFGFDTERLSPRKSLTSLGMDSLMAVELKARLDRLGVAIPVAALLRDMTIAKIVETMLGAFDLSGNSVNSTELENTDTQGNWIVIPRPRPEAKYRMFCFPYAGAGPVVFQKWHENLSPEIEVCTINLPGRSMRLGETALTRIIDIEKLISQALDDYLDKPFFMFGHCMGAIVLYEVAAQLKLSKGIEAQHIFVSGCMAPHLYNSPMVHSLGEKKFLDVLDLISFTSAGALHKDKEILDLMTPMLRADFEAVAHYAESMTTGVVFDAPVTGFAARQDLFAAPVGMQAWRDYTSSNFELQMLDGDHYFIESQADLILSAISQKLELESYKPTDLGDLRISPESMITSVAHHFSNKERLPVKSMSEDLLYWPNGYNSTKMTLFLFPGAWELSVYPDYFPHYINEDWQIAVVQYPGHGLRKNETCKESIYQILNEVYPVLLNYTNMPFALAGHCFGGIIQYELAAQLKSQYKINPEFMIVSAAVSPEIYTAPNGHLLSDGKIIELLNVIDCPILDLLDSPEIYDSAMKLIRSDLCMMAGYSNKSDIILDCPIAAITGEHDLWTYPLQVSSWARYTASTKTKTLMHKGTHFLDRSDQWIFLECINQILVKELALETV